MPVPRHGDALKSGQACHEQEKPLSQRMKIDKQGMQGKQARMTQGTQADNYPRKQCKREMYPLAVHRPYKIYVV